MSYTKLFNDYVTKARVAEGGDRIYLVVETTPGRMDGKYFYESGFVSPPNFIERLFGITWTDKLQAKEKMLLLEVVNKINNNKNPKLQLEIDRFLND